MKNSKTFGVIRADDDKVIEEGLTLREANALLKQEGDDTAYIANRRTDGTWTTEI